MAGNYLRQGINLLPYPLKRALNRVIPWVVYTEYDTSEEWRKKASREGWQAIYWHNEHYNNLFDAEQKRYLQEYLWKNKIDFSEPILDIGCGIGRLSKFLSEMGYKDITGVDFAEMISEAKKRNNADSIYYVASPAQDFLSERKFKLIISSSCFGVIRKRDLLFKSLNNCIAMQQKDAYMLMMDPFHRTKFLAQSRVRISGKEIVTHMKSKGYQLEEKSGMLFFPVKVLITDRYDMSEPTTRRLFCWGERALGFLSKSYLSDYKILSFRKVRLY